MLVGVFDGLRCGFKNACVVRNHSFLPARQAIDRGFLM
jgi:hypothetical protein